VYELHQSAFRAGVTAEQSSNIKENESFTLIVFEVNGWQKMRGFKYSCIHHTVCTQTALCLHTA
jgi:hypothetical protein